MSDITVVTEFLGWCLIINSGVLAFATIMLFFAGGRAKQIHSELSKVPIDQLNSEYFSFLANYKLVILAFNLVPYIALKIVF
ncbi:MAG: hypothetical protein ACJAYC_000818 [Halieaceae bacterium]|jgi:hypothetical protein